MIPSYEAFLDPLLQELAASSESHSLGELAERAADRLNIDPEQRREVIAYDSEPVHRARARLALHELGRAALVAPGQENKGYRLTDRGREAVGRVKDRASLERYPEFAEYRQQYLARRGA